MPLAKKKLPLLLDLLYQGIMHARCGSHSFYCDFTVDVYQIHCELLCLRIRSSNTIQWIEQMVIKRAITLFTLYWNRILNKREPHPTQILVLKANRSAQFTQWHAAGSS